MDEATIARFRTDWAAVLADEGGRYALAVSGGPDSLGLLCLGAAAFPGRVMAATVDHGLRAGSAEEASMVAEACRGLAVPHATLRVSVEPSGEGVQAAARRVRYDVLAAWAEAAGAGALATAHHLDDQAETVLMRLARGSGAGGLAGIRGSRPLTPRVRLVRPLLGWRKAELGEVVRTAGMRAADDPSNRDTAHDRTHARALLAREPLLEPARLAAVAGALADAEEALDWTAKALLAERVGDDGGTADVAGLPRELRRRLLALLLPDARGDALVRLLDRLDAGVGGTLGDRLVRAEGKVWRIGPAPPRRTG